MARRETAWRPAADPDGGFHVVRNQADGMPQIAKGPRGRRRRFCSFDAANRAASAMNAKGVR